MARLYLMAYDIWFDPLKSACYNWLMSKDARTAVLPIARVLVDDKQIHQCTQPGRWPLSKAMFFLCDKERATIIPILMEIPGEKSFIDMFSSFWSDQCPDDLVLWVVRSWKKSYGDVADYILRKDMKYECHHLFECLESRLITFKQSMKLFRAKKAEEANARRLQFDSPISRNHERDPKPKSEPPSPPLPPSSPPTSPPPPPSPPNSPPPSKRSKKAPVTITLEETRSSSSHSSSPSSSSSSSH